MKRFKSVLSAAEFCRSVGLLDHGHFITLIDAGQTPAEKIMNTKINRTQYRLSAVDIEAFHQRFVTLTTMSKETGHHRNKLKSIRLDQAPFLTQRRSALTKAFAISMSLRMIATIASLVGFPAARRSSYLVLRSGLYRMATSAGMYKLLRSGLRPTPMNALPCHWPDWRVIGARPAGTCQRL